MIVSLLLLLVGLLILTGGAEALVRGASSLALRCGLSPLVVGLTVVAFGTSAPELAVSLKASLNGSGDLAVGNVVGSNIFNVAVILGIASLLCPLNVQAQVIRREMPIMVGVSVLFLAFILTGEGISRLEAVILVAGMLAYVSISVYLARRETKVASTEPSAESANLALSALLIVIGLAMLVGGARLMVDQAVILAKMLGMSEALIGLTIVAASTSMPELATSVVAAFRRQADIAVGNIVGSNIFNILFIIGLTGLVAPPIRSGGIGWLDYGFMLATSVILLPLMRTGFTIKRWEGTVLLGCFGAYLALLWPH